MPELKSSAETIARHMGWDVPVTVNVTPEQAHRVLQAVLNDVNPAVMGDTYQTFINSVRYVGAQYGTDI